MKCANCKYLKASISPYRRIAQAKGDELPIKTSPLWCPLKEVLKHDKREDEENELQ